jgi:hypothetical protein
LVRRVGQLERGVKAEEGEEEPGGSEAGEAEKGDPVNMKKLEDDVRRLRLRNSKLEEAVQAGKQAALALAAQGQSLGDVLSTALDRA